MKITHWNFFNTLDSCSGIKRYEHELFMHITKNSNITIKRDQRRNRNIFFNEYKTHDADIVHATFQNIAPIISIKKPNRFILTVHDIIPKFYYSIPKKIKHMWYLVEAYIPKANMIIVDSVYTMHELHQHLKIPYNKIRVIPLGISNRYRPITKLDIDSPLQKVDTTKILINISNKPWKNIETLIQIIDHYNHHSSKLLFVKIGYGDNIKMPNVLNLGVVSEHDLPLIYNSCDLFIHTSAHEGFGLPVLESMACGCPVVCSNATSLPEVVGNGGCLVDTFDKQQYIKAIDTLLSDKQKYTIIQAAGLKQASKFSWDRTAEMTQEAYEECLST